MTCVLVRQGNVDTDRHIERRWCEETHGEEGHLQATEGGLDRAFPHSPQKEPTLLPPFF